MNARANKRRINQQFFGRFHANFFGCQLKMLPGDLPVLVEGYESGWDDIHEIRTAGVVRYRSAHEWDGEYQSADVESNQTEKPVVLLIGRRGMRR